MIQTSDSSTSIHSADYLCGNLFLSRPQLSCSKTYIRDPTVKFLNNDSSWYWLPLGSGSAGRLTNSQPVSSMSSISKQSAVSTRALSDEALRDTEADSGTGTRMSGSPPAQTHRRCRLSFYQQPTFFPNIHIKSNN